jgi:Cu-Zn family superoxide dismutase
MKNFALISGVSYLFYKSFNIKTKCSTDEAERGAICILNPDHNSGAKGIVIFKQSSIDALTSISGKFSGLKKNAKHGFHIHEFGDLSDGCITAGAHYNPTNQTHGNISDKERHVGDLGNIESNENGEASYSAKDNLVSLYGKYSVVGRSCVVHADEDDLGRGGYVDSKTTGHSGIRIACGVIALSDAKKL